MKNLNKVAFPTYGNLLSEGGDPAKGLTKREYFAGLAMQGFIANPVEVPVNDVHYENIAKDSIKIADALLNQFEK